MQIKKQQSEDKITSSLHQFSQYFSLQKNSLANNFRHSYMFQRKNPQKQSFNQLSDWTNTYKIVQSSSLPKIIADKSPRQNIKNMNFTFYKSQLLNRHSSYTTQQGLINQVILKFDPKLISRSLRKSLMSFHKIDKKIDPVANIFKQKLDQRRFKMQKLNQRPNFTIKQKYPMNTTNMAKMHISPKKNEKYTGIIRTLKKRQINRKKKLSLFQNYELITKKIF